MNQIPTKKTVHVWEIPLNASDLTQQRYFDCLAADERARANRFRFPDDRRKFIVARGTLRHLVAEQLHQPPQDIRFDYGDYGKPSLAASTQPPATQTDFHFNLSHSGELALCAVSHHHPVGIDIEKLKPIDHLEGMMARCLLQKEQVTVNAAPDPLAAFLQHWTCKEAYLKAIGKGLSQSMQTVELEMTPPQLMAVPQDCVEGWQLHTIDVPPPYVGALVVAGTAKVHIHDWQHS
ncbi:MAG: 4'-phosphopantetheinyl transferase superfamily protein [Cyanobacteria bacterium J06614_10]